MRTLLILAAVLGVLLLLSLVRLGGSVAFGEGGLLVRLRVGRLWVTLYPMKPKKERRRKPKRETKPPPEPPAEEPKPKESSWPLLRRFLPLVAEAAGRLRRSIRIDRLALDLTVAAEDPATAALAYGGANGALGVLIPLLERSFQLRERDIRTRCDFQRKDSAVELLAALSLSVGQLVALGVYLGLAALHIFIQFQNDKRNEAA